MVTQMQTGISRQIIPPSSETITLDEAKLHLRVDNEEEDLLIAGLIQTAEEHVEAFTKRAIMPQSWELTLSEFPNEIRLPRPPLQVVESISYRGSDGVVRVINPDAYEVESDRIYLVPGASWPSTPLYPGLPIRVRFTAGYEQVPAAIKHAILLLVGHWYNNREAVREGREVNELPFAVSALLWPLRVW